MRPFDSNAYRKEVLRPLLDSSERSFDDAFAVFAVDPGTDDIGAIRRRIEEVVAFWRKEQSSPRYKTLVTALLQSREEISAVLLDPAARAALRNEVVGSRASATAARVERFERMASALQQRHGGIPRTRLDRLRAVAMGDGMTPAEIDERLRSIVIVDDGLADVEPPPPAVRSQLRRLLEEAVQLDPDLGPGRTYRNLFEFLGVDERADRSALVARRDALAARNRQRRHDRFRTVVDELLALTTAWLLDQDHRAYRAGLVADVEDELRPEIEAAVLIDDRVTPADLERLVRHGVDRGLGADAARQSVLRVAREQGAAVETGAALAYVTCASCGSLETPASPADRCRRCAAALHRSCPQCRATVEADAGICPACRFDLRTADELSGAVGAGREALDVGDLAEARWRVDSLRAWAAGQPLVEDLARDVQALEALAAERWTSVVRSLDEGRFDDAADHLGNLERIAGGICGPDGLTIDDARRRIEEGLAELRAAVADARLLPPLDAEIALLALLDGAPGSADVLAALRSIPVAAPSRVLARLHGHSITVSWRTTPSPGPIEYRVFRTSSTADGETVTDRPVGSTRQFELEDAGVVAGSLVTYGVRAVRHGIASGMAATTSVLVAAEVDQLAAIEHDGAIELKWARPPGGGDLWVERSVDGDPNAPMVRMRGGERGILDSDVQASVRYRYRVVVEYPSPAGPPVRTEGREISATGFVVPTPVSSLKLETEGCEARITIPAGDIGTVVVVACDERPDLSPGALVNANRIRHLGRVLEISGRRATDQLEGRPRYYLAATIVGPQAVVGASAEHPGVGEVSDLIAGAETGGMRLRWVWPEGCTEAIVLWSADRPPTGSEDPSASRVKVTNAGYEISDGVMLAPGRTATVHALVLPAARIDGELRPIPGWSDASRASTHVIEPVRVSYRLRRAGLLRRSVQVEVTGGVGTRPPLLLVARTGGRPPDGPNDGKVLATVQPEDEVCAVTLADVQAPAVLGLFSQHVDTVAVVIEDPELAERTIAT